MLLKAQRDGCCCGALLQLLAARTACRALPRPSTCRSSCWKATLQDRTRGFGSLPFRTGQGFVLLLSLSQEHRWCGGFFIFSVWRLKGGRLEKEGREGARGGRREFSGRSSHSFIFPQLLVTARSLTTAVHSRKFPGGFLEYPSVVGWGSSCCWSPVEDDKPRSASSKQRPNSLLWV